MAGDGGPGVQWRGARRDALVAVGALAIVVAIGVFVAWGLDGKVREGEGEGAKDGAKDATTWKDEAGEPQDTPVAELVFREELRPARAAKVKNPHDHEGKPLCQACHVGRTAKLKQEPVALCRSCHEFHSGNHPVGVVQKDPPDPGLPLGPKGEILCHSCHPAHDLGRRKQALRMGFTPMCLRCHTRH